MTPTKTPAPSGAEWKPPTIDQRAVNALYSQTQLDQDGVMVGVSREALDHVLERLPAYREFASDEHSEVPLYDAAPSQAPADENEVTRVAKAICEAAGALWDDPDSGNGQNPEEFYAQYKEEARAAIRAMSAPAAGRLTEDEQATVDALKERWNGGDNYIAGFEAGALMNIIDRLTQEGEK